jgi:hypothetical protein
VRTLELLQRWAWMLDARFRVPGTQIRFGLDPILALIPGVGDLASPIFAIALIVQGVHQRVPKVVLLRMLGNAFLDALIGAVPLAGPIGDIFFRANLRNLNLLERHARPGLPPSRADYVFVFGLALVCGMLIAIPVALGIWMVYALSQFVGRAW